MEVIKRENKFCFSCMEEHEVQTVEIRRKSIFKDEDYEYLETSEYCNITDELSEDEYLIRLNSIAFKDGYKKKAGLLSSRDIVKIRNNYGISQKDLAVVLGWGEKTITRYESYQVQDNAHDDVLRRVTDDPLWFMEKINEAGEKLPKRALDKYKSSAMGLCRVKSNEYSLDAFDCEYLLIGEETKEYGSKKVKLRKAAAAISYIASKVDYPYMTRTFRLLWYSDFLSFKRHGYPITGLGYKALPMGAVPFAYKKLMAIDFIKSTIKESSESCSTIFLESDEFSKKDRSKDEIDCLDTVMDKFRYFKTEELIARMHEEEAYRNTRQGEMISFEWAKDLSID